MHNEYAQSWFKVLNWTPIDHLISRMIPKHHLLL